MCLASARRNLFLPASIASDCGSPPQGFRIQTELGIFFNGFPRIIAHPNINLRGLWDFDDYLASGERRTLPSFATSDDSGLYSVPDGRAPAWWLFGELSGPCAGKEKYLHVKKGETLRLLCDTTCVFLPCNGNQTFAAVPSYIETTNPPATITITGFDIDSTYGMPYVEYWDQSGNLVAQGQASSVAPDGTWLSGATPDLSNVPSSSYWVFIRNVTADGSLQFLGATTIYIDNGQPPPPPPPDPSPCGTGPHGEAMPCQEY